LSRLSGPEKNNGDTISRDNLLVSPGKELGDLDGEQMNWDIPEIDFTDYLNPQTHDTSQEILSGWWPAAVDAIPTIDPTVQFQHAIYSSNWPIPSSPTSNARSLSRRSKVELGAQRTTTLICHTLKSYLLTLRDNSLPPFIHPSLTSEFKMETLENCISLVHMISSGVRGSRKLFWKNVRMECERLCNDVGGDFYGSRKLRIG
jgi:hypothetical protein